MILIVQINLLPPEERVQEGSMVGVLLAGILVILVVFVLIFGMNYTGNQIVRLKRQKATFEKDLGEAQKTLQKINEKEQLVQKALRRQNLIIAISMGKVSWAEKLYELAKIIERHDVWVTSIQMDESSRTFKMRCFAKGRDERKIVEFRRSILNSRSFFSIFENVKFYSDITPATLDVPTKRAEDKEVLTFTLEFRLKPQLALQNLVR